ncbi:probable glucosamine 6-phosphate N-acetyltransferase [Homalodisca vitripennis]|uniref:probable glucosamine 6-phosphate N-acetyltransferase n=1 Tax=Homalodisca vitripennis TaxID=197043 RepID=UPI001EEABA62|nr:probable glucosamine 6-phosphate N-acetyltransferase [Homalodisca vitripennis]
MTLESLELDVYVYRETEWVPRGSPVEPQKKQQIELTQLQQIELTQLQQISQSNIVPADTFRLMKKCPNTYFVVVIEDMTLGKVVGSSTLVLEQKFIHKCALRGRVEDVVVSNDYRGKQLGKLLIATMVLLAEQLGVYKLTLDCRDHMVPFYQAFGYKKEPGNSNYMQIRFRA